MVSRYSRSREERFWEKVEKTETCWNWLGRLNETGYGWFWYDADLKDTKAHRVSWMLTHGEIPNDLFVLHTCDNRRCVRPDHLFLGNNRDNALDMSRKGRARNQISLEKALEILAAKGSPHGTGVALSKRLGVSPSTVSLIQKGKTWKHLSQQTSASLPKPA